MESSLSSGKLCFLLFQLFSMKRLLWLLNFSQTRCLYTDSWLNYLIRRYSKVNFCGLKKTYCCATRIENSCVWHFLIFFSCEILGLHIRIISKSLTFVQITTGSVFTDINFCTLDRNKEVTLFFHFFRRQKIRVKEYRITFVTYHKWSQYTLIRIFAYPYLSID